MVKSMVKASTIMLTDQNMKGIGKMINRMASEFSVFQMEIVMKENSKILSGPEKELTIMPPVINMKESIEEISEMAQVYYI